MDTLILPARTASNSDDSTRLACWKEAAAGYVDAWDSSDPVPKDIVKAAIQGWRASARQNDGFAFQYLKGASYWAGYYSAICRK